MYLEYMYIYECTCIMSVRKHVILFLTRSAQSLRRRTSHTSQEPSKLLAAISSIKLPKFSKPSPAVDLRPLLACYDTIDHSLFLDPAMGFCDVPSDGFIQTKWSPSGLGPTGRQVCSII